MPEHWQLLASDAGSLVLSFLSIYKMSNFYLPRIGNAIWLNFSKIFKYYFHQGYLRKKMKKSFFKKNNNFLLEFLPGFDLYGFFSRFSLFSRVILLIFSNHSLAWCAGGSPHLCCHLCKSRKRKLVQAIKSPMKGPS